jgi:uncharacterized protein YdaU (DUF1376 family)
MKRPWFPLYVADWMLDTEHMTLEEQGAYFRLLCHQWIHGSIPLSEQGLKRILRVDVRSVRRLWETLRAYFAPTSAGDRGDLEPISARSAANLRLRSLESEAEVRSNHGRKAAEIRHHGHATALLTGNAGSMPSQSQSYSQSETDPEKKHTSPSAPAASPSAPLTLLPVEPVREGTDGQEQPTTRRQPRAEKFDFASVYDAYPRKGDGKTKGIARLRSSVRSPEAFEQLQRAVANYAAKVRAEGTDLMFIPHFSTWANGKWRDYIDDPHIVTRQSNARSLPLSTSVDPETAKGMKW